MKKMLLMTVLAFATVATVGAQTATKAPADGGAKMSLADARGQIDQVIESPAKMKEVMKSLSAEDQKQFLADVNKAISEMPASIEEKTALFLNVDHAALTSAQKGNLMTLIAEVFATVPPESLTVINERFASDLLNRAANPEVTYTDEQFTKIALDIMTKVNERTEATDNGSTRSAFAILMLVRASNGSPADLADKLVDTLKNEEAKELARNEWIPAALGKDGRELGYEPILASADAGRRPDFQQVLAVAGPQYLDGILEDALGKNTDKMSFTRTRTPVYDALVNPLGHMVPTLHDEPFAGGERTVAPGGGNPGAIAEERERVPEPKPEPEPPHPGPYPLQHTSGGKR